jgi:MFS family permease
LMTPSLLPELFGIAPFQVQIANLVATSTLCVSTVAIGAATDRFGIRRVAIPILLLLIASTYGLYCGAATMPFALLPIYALAGVGAGGSVLTPIMMIRAFPASVRFSGVSFSYNLAYALFGGLTPLLVSWLVHLDRVMPAHYVAAVTVLGLAATVMAPKHQLSDPDAPGHFDKSCA